MKQLFFISCMAIASGLWSQQQVTDALPYAEIPQYSETYTAETVAARMIDGLGFRYYWATKDLTETDLAFKPSEKARTTAETIDHLYGLCRTISNTVHQKPNVRVEEEAMSFEEKRKRTLLFLKSAADKLRAAPKGTLENSKIVFKRGENSSEFPFWNLINGPIADALWHTGQVVSFRRTSGNPWNSNVSVFNGRLRN